MTGCGDQLDALNAAIGRIIEEVDNNVEPFRAAIEMLKTIPGVSRLSAELIVWESVSIGAGSQRKAI
jgi:transposase